MRADVEPSLYALLERADIIACDQQGNLKSLVRVASLGNDLFLHSAFPTTAADSVFFGPDTYRFCRFLRQQAATIRNGQVIVDMGSGSGAGAVAAARLAPEAEFILVDVNRNALRLAGFNAAAANVSTRLVLADQVPGDCDVLIANPPYLMDASRRAYRDGGQLLGGSVALDWITQGLRQIRSSGAMLIYTGAAYIEGESPLLEAISATCANSGCSVEFDEIDPDVFGEELDQPSYAVVERIAAVGIKIELPIR